MKSAGKTFYLLFNIVVSIFLVVLVMASPALTAQMMQGVVQGRTAVPAVPTVSPVRVETVGKPASSAHHVRGGGVAATPISIPKPISPLKNSLNKIEKTDLISLNKNVMHIRLQYKVDSSLADKLYAGALLYDMNLRDVNARCKPVRKQKSSKGSADVYLVLPAKPFKSATLKTFLKHSGKVVTKKYFKLPFVWDGQHGRIVAPSVIRGGDLSGQVALAGSGQKQPGLLKSNIKRFTRINQNFANGAHVGLDPGLGP